jgi:hypothetical protein
MSLPIIVFPFSSLIVYHRFTTGHFLFSLRQGMRTDKLLAEFVSKSGSPSGRPSKVSGREIIVRGGYNPQRNFALYGYPGHGRIAAGPGTV